MKAFLRMALGLSVLATAGCGLAGPAGLATHASPRAHAGGFFAQGARPTPTAGIDELFAGMTQGVSPGAAVVVLNQGKVVHKKGYGLADLAARRPVGTDTPFDLATVSMSFTAMAVMVLAERGKLGYDDPLARHCPEFQGPARAITIRHLLNHTAGLPDYRQLYADKVAAGAWPQGFEPTSRQILALLAEQRELANPPGEDFGVSPSHYVALAQVVERASGQRFAAFMKQHVFTPLGMSRARVYDESRPQDARHARSYAFRDGAYQDIGASPLNLVYGDGNVHATATDMAKWPRAYTPGVLVSAAALKAATTPPALPAGGRTNYGFGLQVKSSVTGLDMLMHSGAWLGWRTAIITVPEKGFSAVVLSNTKETAALALADEIMQQVVK